MNTLLLIMLFLIEVGLLVLTISEGRTKELWTRNRLIARGTEIVAFLLFALFPGIDFSFRYKVLIVLLVIRLIMAAVGYLIMRYGRGKSDVQGVAKSIGAMTVSVIGSVILIVVALAPSYLFADYNGLTPSGEYDVLTTSLIMVDDSRIEEFEDDGSFREVPVDFFYPDAEDGETFPLIIFSHGAFGFSRSNYSLYEELASNGYVVASLSHPYHAFYCKDSSGKTVTVDQKFMNDTMYINEGGVSEAEIYELTGKWMELRTDDMNFVIDTLESWNETGASNLSVLSYIDFDKIGLIGHSLGGATAVEVGRMRDDIDAVVDLDGTMLGEQIGLTDCDPYEFEGRMYTDKYELDENPYPVAILNIDNQEHHDSRIAAKEIGMPYANNGVMDHAVKGYDTYFVNSGHMNFTDLPLFSPYLASMLGTGSIDSKECIETMNQLVKSFYDDTLKGTGTFVVEESYGN